MQQMMVSCIGDQLFDVPEEVKTRFRIRLERVFLGWLKNERVIEFTPPDGNFELMSYRLNTQLKPLIWVEVNMDQSTKTKIEYNVKAKSNYRNKSVAHNVEIAIPVPNDLKSPVFRVKFFNFNFIL